MLYKLWAASRARPEIMASRQMKSNEWVITQRGRALATLVLLLGAIVTPQLKAQGAGPQSIAFDGVNIWVISGSNVTKVLASTGASVGTYPARGSSATGLPSATALAFDGANIWVADYYSNSVTKLLASTGSIVGTYAV